MRSAWAPRQNVRAYLIQTRRHKAARHLNRYLIHKQGTEEFIVFLKGYASAPFRSIDHAGACGLVHLKQVAGKFCPVVWNFVIGKFDLPACVDFGLGPIFGCRGQVADARGIAVPFRTVFGEANVSRLTIWLT